MNPIILLIALLLLITPTAVAQVSTIHTMWTTVRQLEVQPATTQRDTLLARAYLDFVLELVRNEPGDSGLVYTQKAYRLADTRHWQAGILLALIREASCLNIANRHYEAIRVGLKGLKSAEQQGDRYYQGVFNRSLGNNYDMLDNYDRAIPHYKTCLRLSVGVPALQLTRAHALVELGDAYRFFYKRPDQAKQLIEEAIALYKTHDSTALGYAYDYYGQTLTDLKLFRQAEQSFVRSHGYLSKFRKYYLMPELLLHQAELYVITGQYKQAIATARNGVAYSQQQESLYGMRGAYRVLYESTKALGRTDSALAHHEQYMVLNDSLNQTHNSERFRAVRADYERQTQQDRISQLTISQQRQTQRLLVSGLVILLLFSGYVFYNNRQLRRKNRAISLAQLQGQTLERQRVAADLHDNLGSTLSALYWQLEAIDKTTLSPVEQTVYATIGQQVSRAYNDVRLLSHNLLPIELARQGLAVALRILVDKLNRNTAVQFRLSGADTLPRLDSQTEFELYSICLELVNNTIKHARATEGYLNFTQAGGTLHLTVGDNGAGFANQPANGQGLQNVAARVASVGGSWAVESKPDTGVENRIVVPVKAVVRPA